MKTAISIPDDIFQKAEKFAKNNRSSRSKLYTSALSEYLHRHTKDEITEQLDNLMEDLEENNLGFVNRAARQTLSQSNK